uniref:Sm domain-containing protein n=1 Tax=Macrostomum lignano TaxID=282301 RepID=A0A1I8IKA0_9PLAT
MTRTMVRLPEPQVHRYRKHTARKLQKFEKANKTPYLMVPRFFDMYHPTTTWLINTVRNEKELDRVLSDKVTNSLLRFDPDPNAIQQQHTMMKGNKQFVVTKSKYFQILDRPEMYDTSSSAGSLFGRHTVMYLTPLGLAIYLGKMKAARQLVECINRDTNKKHILARQPQFVTCFGDRYGDLMCMYDHNLAMLCEAYDILHLMLVHNNWFPMEPFRLVYRKRFVETNMWFDDFMDYAFYILFTKRSSMNRAYYADKKLKSTVNLIKAAETFINEGIFKLSGEPMLPFNPKEGRRKRLEALPPFKPRNREPNTEWPSALYEFDCDCCIALLCGLLSKCHRLDKKTSFHAALQLATKTLADGGWLDYFSRISDHEFRDYFMGIDDAEKLRFRPEIFGYVRECVKITVFENRYNLGDFFTDNRLRAEIKDVNDIKNNAILQRLVQCNDDTVTLYVNLPKGEKLKPAATVIGGPRVRGEGRDDPANRYYMDRMEFPAESTKTIMTNTANIEKKQHLIEDNADENDEFSAALAVNSGQSNAVGDRDAASLLIECESDNETGSADSKIEKTVATQAAQKKVTKKVTVLNEKPTRR